MAILIGAGAALVASGSGIASAQPSDSSATRSDSVSGATAEHPRGFSRTGSRPRSPELAAVASVPQSRKPLRSRLPEAVALSGSPLGTLPEAPVSAIALGVSARSVGQQRSVARPAATWSTGQVLDPVAAAKAVAGPVTAFLSGLGAMLSNQRPALHPGQTGHGVNGVVTGTLGATDPDSSSLSYALIGTPAHGTVSVGVDGTYTYTPNPSTAATGTSDSFGVTVSDAASGPHFHGLAGLVNALTFGLVGDAGHTSTATVAVSVAPFNNLPTGYAVVGDPDPGTGGGSGSGPPG